MDTGEEEAAPDAAGSKPAAPRDRLSTDEIKAAITQLASDDMLKLHAIERRLIGGTGYARGDLLHETLCKALLGERRWPRKAPIMACIVQTMKSLSSHARASAQTAKQAEPELAVVTPRAPTPEDDVAQSQIAGIIAAINHALEGDEKAQMVLLGWEDGLRGKALRDLLECDQGTLDYAIRRVREAAMTLYPDGWPL